MRTAPSEARLGASGDVRLYSVAAANTEHDAMKPLQPLDWNMKVWRYIDLPKLINLLETGNPHFSRADTLGHPYEGSWARPDVATREEQFQSIAAELGTSRSPMLEKIRDHFEEKASIDLADPSVSNPMAGGLRGVWAGL